MVFLSVEISVTNVNATTPQVFVMTHATPTFSWVIVIVMVLKIQLGNILTNLNALEDLMKCFVRKKDCPVHSNIQGVFSSETEMIANHFIKSAFWIIGFLIVTENSYIIITSIAFIKKKQAIKGILFQHFIILNISFADFIMGIYLLTIASYDASFSGFYGNVDGEWRSSLKCSIIGSLAVISSESSCFLMVVLTAFKLKNITKPIESLNASFRPWIVSIFAAWLLSLSLSIVPMIKQTSQYFLHSFSYSSNFQNGTFADLQR